MPVVEQRNNREGTVLAIGCAVVLGVVVLVLVFGASLGFPLRKSFVRGPAAVQASGTGNWGSSIGLGADIPDGDPKGFTHAFPPAPTSTPAALVTAFRLDVQLRHPRPEDVEVALIGPDGNEAVVRRRGTPGALSASYTEPALSMVRGKPAAGIWKVRFVDAVRGQAGRVADVKLSVDYKW